MSQRPDLSRAVDAETFLGNYYLKEELTDFCRREGLQTSGGKEILTARIARYLETSEKSVRKTETRSSPFCGNLTEESLIEAGFVCTERHRAFFEERIGRQFSFNVAFQKWLKGNAGKTYAEAITAYGEILEEKKRTKTTIDRQFEYNTYVRDFFADNAGRSLSDAIACWKYKKSLRGSHKYDKSDLTALDFETKE